MMTEHLYRMDAYADSCSATVTAVGPAGIEFDRTVFYPAGGGQAGDSGQIALADGVRISIVDTRKGEQPGQVLHRLDTTQPAAAGIKPGDSVDLQIDWNRRYAHMRLHTCLHLLSCVIVAPVTGGNISTDKGRLDFDIDMNLLNAEQIEREVNALIARGVDTETVWMSDAELDAQPELIKTMSVKPPRGAGRVRLLKIPGIDLQPCGGTHVRNIAEIGSIRVLRIRSEGKRNKRIEIGFQAR
jgi:misacylated tRNA(Ala) deacylase